MEGWRGMMVNERKHGKLQSGDGNVNRRERKVEGWKGVIGNEG